LANIQSQIKRNRQNEKRRLRNRDFRGAARTAVKNALASMAAGQDGPASVMAAISALDKAAAKGAIHHRNAGRRKGRLVKRLAALGLQPKGVSMQAPMPAAPQAASKPPSAQQRQSAKAEKGTAPAPEAKAKAEARKSASKPAPKKAAPKKTAKK
jgi:small subunit ribosomal protein S20